MTIKNLFMNYDKWVEKFFPEKNILLEDAPIDGYMYETYGKEVEYVKSIANEYIWTVVDGDKGNLYIIPGWHFINRLGYIITKKEVDFNIEEILIN